MRMIGHSEVVDNVVRRIASFESHIHLQNYPWSCEKCSSNSALAEIISNIRGLRPTNVDVRRPG